MKIPAPSPTRLDPVGWLSRDPPTHLPPIDGVTLDGAPLALPDGLAADATLVVVAFDPALDARADQWARLAERLTGGHAGRVAALELYVLNRSARLVGDLATEGLRARVDDDAERARTVAVYADRSALRKALGIGRASDVTALLVGRDGAIAWRGSGTIGVDDLASLDAALDGLLAGRPAPE